MTTSPFYIWEYETQVIGDDNDDSNNTAVKEEKIVSSILSPSLCGWTGTSHVLPTYI